MDIKTHNARLYATECQRDKQACAMLAYEIVNSVLYNNVLYDAIYIVIRGAILFHIGLPYRE